MGLPTTRRESVALAWANGVGHFAVQFAKLRGARVIGTASAQNRSFVEELGADEVVDYRVEHVLPLSAASEAHALSEHGHVRGKIVLNAL
jgi:NADPH:quinone reductase-like Zn-dependent oxidoreductase